MRRPLLCGGLAALVLCSFAQASSGAERRGRIAGRLLDSTGQGVRGATVSATGSSTDALTDADGQFILTGLEVGAHTVFFVLGDHLETMEGVMVESGETVEVEATVDWPVSFAETITVVAASRRPERIMEAPAAVTVLTAREIESRAARGQLPRLVASTPGAQLTQSGLYDFNLNVRGFNSLINRRVLVLIDGRDPSAPIQLGTQEWASVAFPLEELERVELVRGPVTALYGAGAFNGILNLTTKSPASSLGGKLRLLVGELSTKRLEGRYAGKIGDRSYFKLYGGLHESESFAKSRDQVVEYRPDLLGLEAIPLVQDEINIRFGGLRFDHGFGDTSILTVEGGTGNFEGTVAQTGNGRFQTTDTKRPWARVNYNRPHWNLLGYYTARDTQDIRGLGANNSVFLDSSTSGFQVDTNWLFAGGKGRFIAGGSYIDQEVDSANPQGFQTVLPRKLGADHQAIFSHAEYDLNDRLKGVVSLRWDKSTLHEDQLSPRLALVYAASSRHTFRATYGEAFQRPGLPEIFSRVPIAPPLDLSALEQALAPVLDGVPLGFEVIPLLAVGNSNLVVEEVASFELGYNGILSNRVFVTASAYRNEIENFVTGLLPQLGTSFGRLNPEFGPYAPPADLSAAAAQVVLEALAVALPPDLFALMSNNTDPARSPIFAFLSFGNFGRVDTQGLELSLGARLSDRWLADANYTFFDFDVKEDAPETPLIPNAPKHQLGLSVSYLGSRLDGTVNVRWVDEMLFRSGIYAGPVPSYTVAEVNLGWRLNERWKFGLDVANLFDNEHYEVFGGDVLGRRALVHTTWSW